MLPLISEKFERFFCRAMFIALCVLPTSVVAGWTYFQRLPGHRLACEQALTRQLGLAVKLGSVEHTRPGDLRLATVELREPETNQLVAKIDKIDARRHRGDWWLTLANTELSLAGCAPLGELLERHLRWPTAGSTAKVHLAASHAAVTNGSHKWKVEQLAATLAAAPRHAEARLVFHWQGAAATQPVALKLVRERDLPEPTTRLDLQTGDAPFPVALLDPWLDGSHWLGRKSTLLGKGRVEIARQAKRWTVEGHFEGVELNQLVTAHFGHQLAGTAQLDLQAEGYGQRVLRASGELASRQGAIGRSLLASLGKELGMTVAPLPAAMGDRFRFEELKLAYTLSDDGSLKLLGGSRYAEGALLVDANGVLLREPPTTQETAGLIRALAASGAPTLPSTSRTAMLSRVLPIRSEPSRGVHYRQPVRKAP